MFDRDPFVSIVIPVYNGSNYMREAIDSALAQTYPHIEVLVVNDGSNDGGETDRIARSYWERIRYFSQENGGVASALNLGIREMKGEYFAWLSHDDVFLPEKIARQIGFLEQNPGFAACYTNYLQIDANGNKLREIATPWLPKKKALKTLFGRQYINGSTMVVKRDCFDQVGMFAEHLRYTQDMEMWLRLLQRFEIGRVAPALAKQRVHPEQGSRKTLSQQKEAQQVLDRSFADLGDKGFLAVAPKPAGSAEERARRHIWYGLTLSRYRGWYVKGTEELDKARACWPSWRNPARLYLLFNGVWPAFHAWQRFRVRIVRRLMGRIRSLAKKT